MLLPLTDVNLIGRDGQTPLHLAAASQKVEKDTDKVFYKDKSEKVRFNWCKLNRNLFILFQLEYSILYYLLHKCSGSEILIQDNVGRTPLHYAIMQGHVNNAAALIEKNKYILNVSHCMEF